MDGWMPLVAKEEDWDVERIDGSWMCTHLEIALPHSAAKGRVGNHELQSMRLVWSWRHGWVLVVKL